MRVHLLVIGAAVIGLAFCDYWLCPPPWALPVGVGCVAIAISAAVIAVARPPGRGSRKKGALLLLATVVAITLMGWLQPIARLRIALSASALAEAAASGAVKYQHPLRIGLFDVTRIFVGGGATFYVEDGRSLPDGWHTQLSAKIVGANGGVPVLGDWSWANRSGLEIR